MCTISCTSEQFGVILEALHYFYLQSEDRLVNMDPDDFGSEYERIWRNRYDLSKELLEKLNVNLNFDYSCHGKFE